MPQPCRPAVLPLVLFAALFPLLPALGQPTEAGGEAEGAPEEGVEEFVEPSTEEPAEVRRLRSRIGGDHHIRFTPRAWFVAPGGNLMLPGEVSGGNDVDIEVLDLDSPRITPLMELHARFASRWSITVNGFTFDIDEGTTLTQNQTLGDVPLRVGDPVESELSLDGGDFLLGYALLDRRWGEGNPKAVPVDLLIDVQLGARIHHVEAEVRNFSTTLPAGAATQTDADELFVEPVVSFHSVLGIDDQWRIEFGASVGGFGSSDRESQSSEVHTSFAWQPTPYFSAHMGFRILIFELEQGSGPSKFEYDGELSGLFWGIDLRF